MNKLDGKNAENNTTSGFFPVEPINSVPLPKDIDPKQFVVLDIETTGLRSREDDLISLSIFDPEKHLGYTHYFPLEKRKEVPDAAADVNGLSKAFLMEHGAAVWTQADVDRVVAVLSLKSKQIITYGSFDLKFLKMYFAEHKLQGLENLRFFNLKSLVGIPGPYFGVSIGSKDVLCQILCIQGVSATHSALNDCLLEWELFKKIDWRTLSYRFGYLIAFSDDYLIPASFFHVVKNTSRLSFLEAFDTSFDLVASFDTKKLAQIKNITFYSALGQGQEMEDALADDLKAIQDDPMADWDFYSDNAQKVVRLVNLINYQTVPTEEAKFTESDHLSDEEEERESLDLSKKADKEFQDMKILLQPVADYLRSNVFGQDPIARQELVIRQDLKVFGKCDFSTPKAIVEMKSLYSKRSLRELSDLYRGQLYVTANNRDCYLLVAQGRKVSIYRVSFRPFGSVFPRRGYASARYTPEELAQKHELEKARRRAKEKTPAYKAMRRRYFKRRRLLARKKRIKAQKRLTTKQKANLLKMRKQKVALWRKEHHQELLEKHREYNRLRSRKKNP